MILSPHKLLAVTPVYSPGGRQPSLLPGRYWLVPSLLPTRPRGLSAELLPKQAGPSLCGCRGSLSPEQGSAFSPAECHWPSVDPVTQPVWIPLGDVANLVVSANFMSKQPIISSRSWKKVLNGMGSRLDPYITVLVTTLKIVYDLLTITFSGQLSK